MSPAKPIWAPQYPQRLWMAGISPVEVAPGKWLAMAVPREETPS